MDMIAPKAFREAYEECALWASTVEYDGREDMPLDQIDVELAPETIMQFDSDCDDFWQHHGDLIEESGLSYGQASHDFWLTRNSHGTGFWDRGLGAIGEALTKACKTYNFVNLYLGDDGRIHGA